MVPLEEFAENAGGDSDDSDDSDGSENNSADMNVDEIGAPKPDSFLSSIYAETTSYLIKFSTDFFDAEATSKLNELNNQIKKQGIEEGMTNKDIQNRLISIKTLAAQFELSLKYFKALNLNSNDEIAKKKINNINAILDGLIKRYIYSQNWRIIVSSRPDENGGKLFKTAASKNFDEFGQISNKDFDVFE